MAQGLGLNGATLPTSDLITGIRSAGAVGFDFYEPRIPAIEGHLARGSGADARTALAEAGVAWLPLNALENVFSCPIADLEKEAERIFSTVAAPCGVHQVIAVPGTVDGPLDLGDAVGQLERLKAVAASHGITLLYEFIGFGHHAFPSLAQAQEVASASGLQLVLDTFHLAVSRTPIEAIAALSGGDIGLVHLSDAYVPSGDVGEITDPDRVLSGEGQLPLAEILAAILGTGYEGPISVEVFHPKYGERAAGDVAQDAFERASSLVAQCQQVVGDA